MKEEYERIEIAVTEFDSEDVITTSEMEPLRYSKYEGIVPY